MKRLLLPCVLICSILLACSLSGKPGTGNQANATGTGSQVNATGTGSQVNGLLSDPQVGLDGLDDYTATLTVSFKGTQAGKPVDLTDTYVQTKWPKLAAQFTSIDVMDDSGAHQVILSGAVGEAQYYQADPNSPCTVNWGATADGPANFMPASLLPSVTTARLADEQTLDGIATQHYTFDAASLGLPSDASASGETWIATQGGYVVKYVLDINGADSVFGTGVTGTQHMEYTLSQVGAQAQVVYPVGCEPVLSDMPAMEDASDLTRLPGLLDYSTNAAQTDIFAFYQDKLTAMGWQKDSDDGIGSDSASMTFTRSDSSVDVTVAVEVEGSSQRVTVMIPVKGSAAAGTTESTTSTPGGAANQNPTALIAMAMGKLLGDENTPSVFPSYTMSMNESIPSASGSAATTLQVEAQAANYHFVLSSGGTQTDAIHFKGQDYSVVNGKAQPGSATLAMNWDMWKLDPGVIFGAATASTITAQAGTTLEGQQIDVYSVDSSTLGAPLPDTSMGLLPYVITAIQGTVWIDHATGGLVKTDLQFAANVRKPGETTPSASGKGEFHLTVSQIGQVTVSLP
jgi:hypothetical protein